MKKFLSLLLCLCLLIPCAFAEEAKGHTDAWLEEKALEMAVLFHEALNCDDYIASFTTEDQILSTAKALRSTDFSAPTGMQVLSQPVSLMELEQMLTSTWQGTSLTPALQDYLLQKTASALPTAMLGQMGTYMLALNNILSIVSAYVAPEGLQGSAYVLLTYEGDYALCITFTYYDSMAVIAQTTLVPATMTSSFQ